jgi:hypothetical protein
MGGAFSLIYVIEKQQLEEARLFKELFIQFNGQLNENLNRIESEGVITSEDRDTLNDTARGNTRFRRGQSNR